MEKLGLDPKEKMRSLKMQWQLLIRYKPNQVSTHERVVKAEAARREFFAHAFRRMAEHLDLTSGEVHDLGTSNDPTTHEQLSKQMPNAKYVAYEQNPVLAEMLRQELSPGMPIEIRSDYLEPSKADIAIAKYPADEKEAFRVAAKHLTKGKIFMLGTEPIQLDHPKNQAYFNELAKQNGFKPIKLPNDLKELHKDGRFYLGLYKKI